MAKNRNDLSVWPKTVVNLVPAVPASQMTYDQYLYAVAMQALIPKIDPSLFDPKHEKDLPKFRAGFKKALREFVCQTIEAQQEDK